MKVICPTNQKGGVGKTTITINLAVGLSREGRALSFDTQRYCSKVLTNDMNGSPFKKVTAFFLDRKNNTGFNFLFIDMNVWIFNINLGDIIFVGHCLLRIIKTSLTSSSLLDAEAVREEALCDVLQNQRDKQDALINEFIDKKLKVISENVTDIAVQISQYIREWNALFLSARYFDKNSSMANDGEYVIESIKTVFKGKEATV